MRTWIVTHNCNYNCHFCTRKNITDDISEEECLKIVDFFNYDNDINSSIMIFGGEPTIWPHLFLVFERLKYKKILLTSNLSCNSDYLRKLIKIRNFQILASYHSDYSKKEEFIKNIKILYENDIEIVLSMTFENLDDNYIYSNYFTLYKEISNTMPNVIFKIRGYNYNNVNKDILDQFNKINSLTNNIKTSKFTTKKINLKYENCYTNRLCVDYNGDVYICQSDSDKEKKFPLYNILLKNDWKKLHEKLKKP